ncbi:MAG TPA: helix-turn-helix domain-containing protein [Candidatus Dormibacteraeota bacterium]|nr:helix-turn-helix domain-containing protein [Candidatus Dormibacteraeota bacterium]
MIEPLESIESTAKSLALSPWTVRAYIKKGKIKPVRIGRRVLIEQAEIRRIVEEGRSDPTAQTDGAEE